MNFQHTALLFLLTSLCSSKGVVSIDHELSRTIQGDNSSPLLDYVMETIALTTPVFEYGSTYQLCKSGDVPIRRIATAVVANYTMIVVLKYTIRRERPDRRYHPRLWNTRITPSFPSGHVASSAFFTTWVSTYYPRWTIPAALLTLVSAYSQVYVGNHYVGDALGGMVLGVVMGKVMLHKKNSTPKGNSPVVLGIRIPLSSLNAK